MSPPKKVGGRTPHHRGQPSTDNTNGYHTANQHSNACVRQLRARRAASYRLAVLDCGSSDPWRYGPPANGYEDAAAHLLEHGLLPAPDRQGLQAMWKAGGRSRQAAEFIVQAWGLVA